MPLSEEERIKRIRKGLKKKLEELDESIENLRYGEQKCLETGLDGTYDREQYRWLEAYKSYFRSAYSSIEDICISVEILEGKDPKRFADRFYREEKLFGLMQDLGLIENFEFFVKMHEKIEYMFSRFFTENMTQYTKELIQLSEGFYKAAASLSEKVAPKYLEPYAEELAQYPDEDD